MAFLFSALFIQAKNVGSDLELRKIKKQLDAQIAFPKKLKTAEFHENATVVFSLDENGKATLEEVQTENTELKKYIEQEFESISIKTNSDYLNRKFKVNVNFKVI